MNSWARRERVDQLLILDPDVNLLYVPKLIQFTSINPNNTYRYDTSGILACKHGSDSCLTAAPGKQQHQVNNQSLVALPNLELSHLINISQLPIHWNLRPVFAG